MMNNEICSCNDPMIGTNNVCCVCAKHYQAKTRMFSIEEVEQMVLNSGHLNSSQYFWMMEIFQGIKDEQKKKQLLGGGDES